MVDTRVVGERGTYTSWIIYLFVKWYGTVKEFVSDLCKEQTIRIPELKCRHIQKHHVLQPGKHLHCSGHVVVIHGTAKTSTVSIVSECTPSKKYTNIQSLKSLQLSERLRYCATQVIVCEISTTKLYSGFVTDRKMYRKTNDVRLPNEDGRNPVKLF